MEIFANIFDLPLELGCLISRNLGPVTNGLLVIVFSLSIELRLGLNVGRNLHLFLFLLGDIFAHGGALIHDLYISLVVLDVNILVSMNRNALLRLASDGRLSSTYGSGADRGGKTRTVDADTSTWARRNTLRSGSSCQ